MPTHAFTRRALGAALVSLMALAGNSTAWAQSPAWPGKPVRFINSFPPGGPSDILARTTAEVLQKQFNQPFVVENRAGAAGNVGADLVARSTGDGHTLLWGIDTTHTVNPHIYRPLPYRETDLKPLVVLSSSGLLLGVHPRTGLKTLKDFLVAARTRDLNFSSGGNGSPGHLWINVINESAGTRLSHVPYRGNSPAVMAAVAGEVEGGTLATPGMLPQVKAGKLNALAVTSRARSQLAPDIPTVGELGLRELEAEVLYVVMAPASTPAPLMQAMSRAILDALARPELQNRLRELDMTQEGLAGTDAERRLRDLHVRYGRVIRATGMKVD
jgi:tripartite-type tricarboxylate transporter receptor subunit TctC